MNVRIGSLFSGYGGLTLAAEAAFGGTTAWVSDIEPGPRRVLARRFPHAPNLGDITAIDWSTVEPVDVIDGGSPCQDPSTAGRRAGMKAGTRSGLWESMREAVAVIRPRYVIWENVRGAYSARATSAMESDPRPLGERPAGQPVLRALGRVLGDLADLGYDAQWCGLRAADVGAPHGRFRVFLLATDASRIGGHEALKHDGRGAAGSDWRGVLDQRDREPLRTRPDRGLTLLPAPRATQAGYANDGRGGRSLDVEARLLPTPSACVANDGEAPGTWLERRERVKETARNGNGMGMPPTIAVQLLPTPRATDGTKGGPNQRGSSGDLMLPSAVHRDWGKYAAAITRWEAIHGPAPAPTMTSPRSGNQQLSPAFTEWMMGLPAGWITDVPGVTRAEALKLCGNGVVPRQAYAAIMFMLDRFGGVDYK